MKKLPVQRVSLITLGVADLAVSRKFYGDLGWTPKDEVPGKVVFYQLHGAVLGLFGLGPLAGDQGRPDAKLGTGAITLAQNFRNEAEVDEAFAAALAVGATALKAPEKVFWGGYSGYYADPDGHPWEISFNPFWDLDDDGIQTLPDEAPTA
jgi:predicted lactoylglutathione lyase